MRLKVKNNQRYIIGRGGHGFPPNETRTVTVNSQAAYREIKACSYLDVEVLEADDTGDDGGGEADDTDDGVDFSEMTMDAIYEYAEEHGIDAPKGVNKAELVSFMEEWVETE